MKREKERKSEKRKKQNHQEQKNHAHLNENSIACTIIQSNNKEFQ